MPGVALEERPGKLGLRERAKNSAEFYGGSERAIPGSPKNI